MDSIHIVSEKHQLDAVLHLRFVTHVDLNDKTRSVEAWDGAKAKDGTDYAFHFWKHWPKYESIGLVEALQRQPDGGYAMIDVNDFDFSFRLAGEMTIKQAAELRGKSQQAFRDILRDDARRAELLPSARFVGTKERGVWYLNREEVERIPFRGE